jgi:hypothetical protein
MKLRLSPAVLALLACLTTAVTTVSAHAQGALYFNPQFSHISNSKADTGVFAFLGDGVTSRMFYGVSFGGYYDAVRGKRFDVGIDIRDQLVHGNSASLNSFLLGPRVAYKPENFAYRPYIQLSAGEGRSRPATNPAHLNRVAYEIFAGLDRPIAKHVDLRIIEVGYGAVSTINSSNFGFNTTFSASHVLDFSTGFVFRIP